LREQFHAATADELYELRLFESSGDEVEARIRDNQDVACNWSSFGAEPHGDGRMRLVLVERSSLAIAFVVGDGVHFGRVVAPTAAEADAVAARFRRA
jgi:hypothetical protein